MAIIQQQVENIKNNVSEMLLLTRKQITRSQEALFGFDKEITEEIIANEKKINALDLKISKDCEQILALYNPVADDLRLIISVISITTFLERIGDNAESIAKFINDFETPFETEIYNKLRLMEIYEHVLFMTDVVTNAFEDEDTSKAAKVFKLDKTIDEINEADTKIMAEIIRNDLARTESYLRLISVVRKLERVGDLLKNIAEEIFFYVDAKVLKHKSKKKNKLMDEDE
jgi:phosphate transport system protein